MNVGRNGNVINHVIASEDSVVYNDFIAFQDNDGAVFHMRKEDVFKLYNQIMVTQTEQTQLDLDSFFVGE